MASLFGPPLIEDNTLNPNCDEGNVSSLLAPSVKKDISRNSGRQKFTVVNSDYVFTKGVFHSSKDDTASFSPSHNVDDGDVASEVSLSSVLPLSL